MVPKRNHALTLTVSHEQDPSISPQPQKKRKKQSTTIADTDYTDFQIRAFKAGIAKIVDWTSVSVVQKHVQVIHWFDVQGLSREECLKRYPRKKDHPCSMADVCKVYDTYAPLFYAEKGVQYVPLGKRGAATGGVDKEVKKKEKEEKVSKKTSIPVDVRLKEQFRALPAPKQRRVNGASARDAWMPYACRYHSASNTPSDLPLTDQDTVTFLCKTASITYGPPSGLQIPRTSIHRHCSTIRHSLVNNPHIDTITHGPEISLDTISCLAACINPVAQPTLPTHITTPYGTFEQEWSMAELEDLYVLAVTLGAGLVCDLVIDRWVEDLRRREARVVVDEFGEAWYVSVLGFGPELLNFLWVNDEKGFAFLANILISHGWKGYERMEEMQLANWHEGVKKALTQIMKQGRAIELWSAPRESICAAFHHHSPHDFPTLPAPAPPPLRPKMVPARKISARPTLNTRPRYEDFDQDSPNTLRLTVPPFPHVHNNYPRISRADLDPIYTVARRGMDRLREHRNSHVEKRIQYANPQFNAHHDTEEVCREKLRMCRDKAALFEREGMTISDEEVEKVLDGQEDDEEDSLEMEHVEVESEEEF